MKIVNLRHKDKFGFVSLKTSLFTAGTLLATASAGTAVALTLTSAPAENNFSLQSNGSNICVTATLAEDPSIFATRGNCGTDTPDEELPGGGPPTPDETVEGRMVTVWNTNLAPNCQQIDLPITEFDGTVNWNGEATNSNTSHKFETNPGLVKIAVDGTFPNWGGYDWVYSAWNASEQADSNCIVSVDSWGETETTDLSSAFSGAINLEHVEQIPSTTTNLSHAFSYNNDPYDPDRRFTLGPWNTSNVVDMSWMFAQSQLADETLNFDTSNVVNMSSMFYSEGYQESTFNAPINFDTKNVELMSYMFTNNRFFNQPVNFDTGKVRRMTAMFENTAAFNQPINFNTENVTSMIGMFKNATAFNQPVNLDTVNVEDMTEMFSGATLFDQDISNWKTQNVNNMEGMFANAASFNQDLSGWNTSKIRTDPVGGFDLGANSWTKPRPIFPDFNLPQ